MAVRAASSIPPCHTHRGISVPVSSPYCLFTIVWRIKHSQTVRSSILHDGPSCYFKRVTAGTQYSDGVVGALVVHPSQDVVGWPAWDEDLLVQMADWYHTFSTELLELFMRVRYEKVALHHSAHSR